MLFLVIPNKVDTCDIYVVTCDIELCCYIFVLFNNVVLYTCVI